MTVSPPVAVMIVDDDIWTTRALELELAADPQVTVIGTFLSGEEAVDAAPILRPDVVLMDINMPGIGGVEATVQLLVGDPSCRVVILSTVAPGPGLARALQAGAVAAVHKTAAPDSLAAIVHAAAGEETPRLVRHLAGNVLLSGTMIDDAPAVFEELTDREQEILQLICEGLDYSEIAARSYISINTVKTHARLLREKLGAANLAQLVVQAVRLRYVTPL